MIIDKKQILSVLSLGLALFTLSCGSSEKQSYSLPPEAKTLLTADSTKTWKLARRFNGKTRMNMGDCFLSYRQTIKADMTLHDNNGDHRDCGESLHARWKLAKDKKGNSFIKVMSDQLPRLMHIEDEFKVFKILYLSEEEMVVQFSHQQFSDKTTIITDILVPENISIEDRDFHW